MTRLLRIAGLSAIAVIGLTGFLCARPASVEGAQTTPSDTTALLYVANQNGAVVSVIDMASNTVVATVDLQALGFSATAKPHHIVVEPDGSAWYVSLIAENHVLKFDRANQLVGQVEFERPGMMALDPASDLLYVGRSMAAVNPPQRIGIVDRTTMELDEVDVFFPRPHAIAVSPSGRFVYSASLALNQLGAYDTETDAVELETVDGPTHTFVQFALTPDGNTLFATGQLTGTLLVFDVSQSPDIQLTGTIQLGHQPWHPVITPDGRLLYVGNKDDNSVSVVDLETLTVVTTITGRGLAEPHGSAVSADGKYVYISNRNLKGAYMPTEQQDGGEGPVGTVVVINTASNTIETVIEVDRYPAGIGTMTRRPE
jgi:YVTN family beta-propeller protein